MHGLRMVVHSIHPQKFADIHHNLALIYSEIPVSNEEKAIWTAFCASSFKNAIDFYTKDEFPYEHAMVCHNYATALLGFPEAKLHNNLSKAEKLFDTALEIRTANQFPFERTLTLLNQLSLYWLSHNNDLTSEWEKYGVMVNKAQEILMLTEDKSIKEKAEEHIRQLEALKTII